MESEFSRTAMGQRYYQKTMPDIAQQLMNMNQNLETLIELIRESLEIDKQIHKEKSETLW